MKKPPLNHVQSDRVKKSRTKRLDKNKIRKIINLGKTRCSCAVDCAGLAALGLRHCKIFVHLPV